MDDDNQSADAPSEPEVVEPTAEVTEQTASTEPVVDQTKSVGDLQKAAKKFPTKALLVVVVVVLLGVAGWLFMKSSSGGSEQTDLNNSVAKFIKMEGVSATVELVGEEDVPLDFGVHLDSRVPALLVDFSMVQPESSLGAGDGLTIGLGLRGIGDTWYFNLEGISWLPLLASDFVAEEIAGLLDSLATSLLALDGQWLYIDSEILTGLSTELFGADLTSGYGNIGIDSVLKHSDFVTLSELYLAHPFLVIQASKPDELSGGKAQKLTVTIDASQMTAFGDALAAADFDSTLLQSLSLSATEDSEVTEESVADFEMDIWMVDGEVVRVPMTEDDSAFLNLSYGEEVEVSPPAGARPLEAADLDSLMSAFSTL